MCFLSALKNLMLNKLIKVNSSWIPIESCFCDIIGTSKESCFDLSGENSFSITKLFYSPKLEFCPAIICFFGLIFNFFRIKP